MMGLGQKGRDIAFLQVQTVTNDTAHDQTAEMAKRLLGLQCKYEVDAMQYKCSGFSFYAPAND